MQSAPSIRQNQPIGRTGSGREADGGETRARRLQSPGPRARIVRYFTARGAKKQTRPEPGENESAGSSNLVLAGTETVNGSLAEGNATVSGELAGRVATGIGLYLLALVTCVGNGMVIHAIRTEKRLRKVVRPECSGARVAPSFSIVETLNAFKEPSRRMDGVGRTLSTHRGEDSISRGRSGRAPGPAHRGQRSNSRVGFPGNRTLPAQKGAL